MESSELVEEMAYNAATEGSEGRIAHIADASEEGNDPSKGHLDNDAARTLIRMAHCEIRWQEWRES